MRRSQFASLMLVAIACTSVMALPSVAPAAQTPGQPAKPVALDVNTASASDLARLPGLDDDSAIKIVDHRPYASLEELSRAGLKTEEISKLKDLLTVKPAAKPAAGAPAANAGGAKTSAANKAVPPPVEKPAPTANEASGKATTPTGNDAQTAAGKLDGKKLDLNTASEKEVEALPGVGAAGAKAILAGRPYKSVSELSKTGMPAAALAKLTPLVRVGGESTEYDEHEELAPGVGGRTPPTIVWVNTDTKVFHWPGDQFYGRTKDGKFMLEPDALKDGYRAARIKPNPNDNN